MLGRTRLTEARAWFCLSYAIFIVGQYVIHAPAVVSVFFYLVVCPSLIWYARQVPSIWQKVREDRLWQCYAALLIYVGVQSVFFPVHVADIPSSLSSTASTATFLVASVIFFATLSDEQSERFWTVLGLVGATGAAASISVHFAHQGVLDRLEGIGRANNPNHTGYVYVIAGLAMMLCRNRFLSTRSGTLVWGLGILAITVAIFLTQGRTAIALHVTCLGIMIAQPAWSPWRTRIVDTVLVLFGTVFIGLQLSSRLEQRLTEYVGLLWGRGDSYRFELWKTAWALYREHPWMGYGLDAPIGNAITESAHNVYLSTFLYFGVPAGVLLVVATLWTVVSASKVLLTRKDTLAVFGLLLLFTGLVSGVVDHRQIVRGPCPMWTIFWLPVAFAMAARQRQRFDQVEVSDS
jgi:O-antigen ligase